VAEDVLHLGQRGVAVEQHARLGVPEMVRRGGHADRLGVVLDDAPHRLRPEAPPLAAVASSRAAVIVVAQEDRLQGICPRGDVVLQGLLRGGVEEDDALFVALAADQRPIGMAILDVEAIQSRGFFAAHAGTKKGQDEGAIAQHLQSARAAALFG